MLSEFDSMTLSLQERGNTLTDFIGNIEVMCQFVEDSKFDADSSLYRCKFKPQRVRDLSSFETRVAKIQNANENCLNRSKKNAVESLRRIVSVSSTENDRTLNMRERLTKRRKESRESCAYEDCRFAMGSSAEFERLFSISANVLTDNRKFLTPELFEEIVFLKQKCELCGEDLVSQAITNARNQTAGDPTRAHENRLTQESTM